ncbi:MAG: hypothetical protein HC897_18715 [Thermoanaerobaculia bacterium]|nr:hypothetical protein [Thermoanaerobaculia bacterium]
MEYWSIIGRACIEDGFRAELLKRVVPGESDTSKLVDLWDFLCGPGPNYRITRWELGDLNRIFSKLQTTTRAAEQGPMQKTAAKWQGVQAKLFKTTRSVRTQNYKEVCSLVGVSCIDHEIRERFETAAKSPGDLEAPLAAIRAAAEDAPRFFLTDQDVEIVSGFFSDTGMMHHLEEIHDAIWIVPKQELAALRLEKPLNVACSGGTTVRMKPGKLPYIHLSSPVVDQLPHAQPEALKPFGLF